LAAKAHKKTQKFRNEGSLIDLDPPVFFAFFARVGFPFGHALLRSMIF